MNGRHEWRNKRRYADEKISDFDDAMESAEWDRRNIEPNLSPTDVLINLAGWGAIIAIVIAMIWFVLR